MILQQLTYLFRIILMNGAIVNTKIYFINMVMIQDAEFGIQIQYKNI